MTVLLCTACTLFLTACSPRPAAPSDLPAIPYHHPANWVLRPATDQPMLPFDVFYVYPTVVANHEQPLMSWTHEAIREKTIHISRQQSGVFSSFANVYAPYCRQLEFYRAWEALTGPEAPDYGAMTQGILDVRDAFAYYMEHYNQGRPFILLGHSQGAMDLFFLMQEEFDDPNLFDKLIAAYLIGMAIHPSDIEDHPHLKPAQRADDTGVIVTYSTELPEAAASPFSGSNLFCMNPLNWQTSGIPAPASLNQGAVFFDGENHIEKEIPDFCSARIDPERNVVLVVPTVSGIYDAPRLLGKGITHMNDLYFFYRNLEQNGRLRANRFTRH
jgi:Protein of unknown function (DUF3089)